MTLQRFQILGNQVHLKSVSFIIVDFYHPVSPQKEYFFITTRSKDAAVKAVTRVAVESYSASPPRLKEEHCRLRIIHVKDLLLCWDMVFQFWRRWPHSLLLSNHLSFVPKISVSLSSDECPLSFKGGWNNDFWPCSVEPCILLRRFTVLYSITAGHC